MRCQIELISFRFIESPTIKWDRNSGNRKRLIDHHCLSNCWEKKLMRMDELGDEGGKKVSE